MHDRATYMKLRQQFIDIRREQRDAIARAMSSRLDPSGQPIFRVVESSNLDFLTGQGSETYARWSQLDPPTDLRYWQW